MQLILSSFVFLYLLASCSNSPETSIYANNLMKPDKTKNIYQNKIPVIHVYVALCDNEHQGIIPVPSAIGNGNDADKNLYWGCDYGIKTFFKKRTAWKLVQSTKNPATDILERCIFEHTTTKAVLIADAYNGAAIKKCTHHFLSACSGSSNESIIIGLDTIGIGGGSSMLAYIGHDGLMDFNLDSLLTRKNTKERDCIILACKSKQYFTDPIKKSGANPLLWTTQLMCPEAYTLDAAISGWLQKKSPEQIHELSAIAYSKYQHCSNKAAKGLLATGF